MNKEMKYCRECRKFTRSPLTACPECSAYLIPVRTVGAGIVFDIICGISIAVIIASICFLLTIE